MPIRADAFFLKMSTQASGHPQWTLVADRIAWHPHEPDAALNVTAGAAALGARGMDISRFDDVVQGQPLVQEDREAFYQLLWTVRRLPTSSETPAEMQLQRELGTLITRPKQVPGERLRVTGTARRALRVRVPDADINARFGIDHYYEVDIAVPLEQVLVLRDPQDGQELQYGATFPVTLCLAELPNGMPLGDDIRQAISTDAFFLKLRSYRSQFVEEQTTNANGTLKRSQLSPLLIANTLSLVEPPTPRTSGPGISLAAIIFGGTSGIFILRCWYARSDRPFSEWRRKSRGDQMIN